ncbi:MAG: MSCRAMM family adhesin SdrC [Pirellulales bacterium]|nr:MSCRAMM family adhesin SdrC [Pirellulales bacterium]
MASPFYYFRKHQKAFLAVAAVLAMVIFVFADLLSSAVLSSRGKDPRSDMTVATWNGGSMTGQELHGLTQRRLFISRILTDLKESGARRVFDKGGSPMEPTVPSFILPKNATIDNISSVCISNRILAQLAQEAGIAVSDDQINHYLKEISFGQLGAQEIQLALRSGRQGDLRQSEEWLFSGLREMLLANTYRSSYSSALRCVTPEQRWQDWRRVNERISVEAAILPAEHFVAMVPEPDEIEVEAFYDQYKNEIGGGQQLVMGRPLPTRQPGFKEPRRVRLQYLLGELAPKAEEVSDSISEEEIVDYYEKNKQQDFVERKAPAAEDVAETVDATDTKTDESSEASTDTKVAPETGAGTDSETDSQPDEETNAATDEESGAEVGAKSAENAEDGPPAQDNSSSRVRRAGPFRLVATEDETDSDREDADEEGETRVADGALESDSDQPPPALPDAPVTPDSENANSENGGDSGGAVESPADQPDDEAVEYVPLESVRDQIRRQLANKKGAVELERIAHRANGRLETEYQPYGLQVAEAKDQKSDPPPPPPNLQDLAAMAKEMGLVHETTILLSYRALADTHVGAATDAQGQALNNGQRQALSVRQAAFTTLDLFKPFLAKDLDGNWYVVIKTEDRAARVPPLDEIRDQVVDAWKKREAARLALEEAEQLAKNAEQAGSTLDHFFAGKKFKTVTTDMFSWLTFGPIPLEYQQRPPQLGEAPPLQSVGTEFMTKAFQLESEKVVAMLNHDQSQAYVIRLASREQTLAQLRQQFLVDANSSIASYIMTGLRARNAQTSLETRLRDRVQLDEKLNEYLRGDAEP